MRMKMMTAAAAFCVWAAFPGTLCSQQWSFSPNVRDLDVWQNIGLDLTVSCAFGGTTLYASAGSGYELETFYGEDPAYSSRYRRLNAQGFLGVQQEIAKGWLSAFVFLKERYDLNSAAPGEDPQIFHSGLPDSSGIQQVSIVAGVTLGTVTFDQAYGTRSGIRASAAWEYAPAAANAVADYHRLDASVTAYVPIIKRDSLTLYIADRLVFDDLFGGYVPINARRSFCGCCALPAVQMPLMRGTDPGRFEGCMKAVNNLDIRMKFPGLQFWTVIPGAAAFCDVGFTDNPAAARNGNNVRIVLGAGPTAHVRMLGFDLDLGLYGAVSALDGGFALLFMLSDYF